MDSIPPQISTELVIHTHVPLYFLLSPCVKCYCWKTNEKAKTHCTNGLEKNILFSWEEQKKCVEVWQIDYFSVIKILCEPDRTSAA